MDDILAEVQKILRQVEDELTPILEQGIIASITIHCGASQSIIEVNRKLTIARKAKPKSPPAAGWEPKRS